MKIVTFSGNEPELIHNYRPLCMTFATFSYICACISRSFEYIALATVRLELTNANPLSLHHILELCDHNGAISSS